MSEPKKTIEELAAIANAKLIPEKSRSAYYLAYNKFLRWQKEQGHEGDFSETVFLAYFVHLSQSYSPNTLWSIQSKIKSVMISEHNLDIKKLYPKLYAYLKTENKGYKPKKAAIFTTEEMATFLKVADPYVYLIEKVTI